MARLFGTPELYHGFGSLAELKNLKGKKAVIVIGGNSVKANGTLGKVEEILKSINMDYAVFSGVEADPSVQTVYRGVDFFNAEQPDWIIGLGGCSAIDAAKAMWVIYEHPNITFPEMVKVFGIPPLRNKARFAAIPSTSGTGTEITAVSVITDRENKVKYPLVSYEILPDFAIVDGELCVSMPDHVTANTGLDALTHCVEAYISNIDDNYADAMAKGGIELIFANLRTAVAEPENAKARQNMHDASCLGGYAFTNAWLGIAHSMAHQIGGTFGVPHGCANAIVLPNVIRYNSKATDRCDELARLVGKTTTEEFALAIENLRKDVRVPASIKEYGIAEADWMAEVDRMAEHAMEDACTGFNIRKPTQEDLRNFLVAIYNGDRVDF